MLKSEFHALLYLLRFSWHFIQRSTLKWQGGRDPYKMGCDSALKEAGVETGSMWPGPRLEPEWSWGWNWTYITWASTRPKRKLGPIPNPYELAHDSAQKKVGIETKPIWIGSRLGHKGRWGRDRTHMTWATTRFRRKLGSRPYSYELGHDSTLKEDGAETGPIWPRPQLSIKTKRGSNTRPI